MLDGARDALLTPFGKKTLENQYLQGQETYQEMFARVACAFADDQAHAQRLYDGMSRLWWMAATPVLANAGTDRGLPISCFLNETEDSLDQIVALWTENAYLASHGGGIGSFWGNVRSNSEKVKAGGTAVGVIPFIKVMESLSLAIDQGSLRRGAAAAYLPIHHPEIEEFLELRKPTGGDHNRKALYLHHGVTITDAFMQAVEKGEMWDLVSPKDGHLVKQVPARDLWIRLLTMRIETGEPYVIFIDHVNRGRPVHHKQLGLDVKMSNLCTEITLPTGIDHHGQARTAVCCLSSLNVEKYLEWQNDPHLIPDVLRFLDNVLTYFIEHAPAGMARAVYAAMRERSVGLGVMGLHAFFQSQGVPWESAVAKAWNKKIFTYIHDQGHKVCAALAHERGPCPDACDAGVMRRFSHIFAVAPTASISIICGGTSPGIEPYVTNAYTHKTLSGSFFVRNTHLQRALQKVGLNTEEIWDDIVQNGGSVQHLQALDQHTKNVFKTAFEIAPQWLLELAGDRQPLICQGQSLNLFLPSTVHKQVLHDVHYHAWKTHKVKSLYYLRSLSTQRAESSLAARDSAPLQPQKGELPLAYPTAGQECLACQ